MYERRRQDADGFEETYHLRMICFWILFCYSLYLSLLAQILIRYVMIEIISTMVKKIESYWLI